MEAYTIPGTDLRVSKLCLGTMMFGGKTGEEESIQLIHAALADGVTFFDTADSYNSGQSEMILGHALSGRRSEVVLASKVYYPVHEDDDYGLQPARLRSHLENSLRRLGTDYLDIYYLHQPDYDTPLGAVLEQVHAFIREGKIRHYGVSNYAAWQVADIFALAASLGMPAPVVTQNAFNIVTRGIEAELVPFAKSRNLPILAYNPLAGGLLTGRYSLTDADMRGRLMQDEKYNKRYMSRHNLSVVAELSELSRQFGRPLAETALLWVYQNEKITSLILGVSSLRQYRENMLTLRGKPLSTSEFEKIAEVGDTHYQRGFDYFR